MWIWLKPSTKWLLLLLLLQVFATCVAVMVMASSTTASTEDRTCTCWRWPLVLVAVVVVAAAAVAPSRSAARGPLAASRSALRYKRVNDMTIGRCSDDVYRLLPSMKRFDAGDTRQWNICRSISGHISIGVLYFSTIEVMRHIQHFTCVVRWTRTRLSDRLFSVCQSSGAEHALSFVAFDGQLYTL